MHKAFHLIGTVATKLFYNKQTSVALLMAIGATAAFGTYASGPVQASVITVVGSGKYGLDVTCLDSDGRQLYIEALAPGPGERPFRVMTGRPVECEIVSGTLQRPASVLPGERTTVDFSK